MSDRRPLRVVIVDDEPLAREGVRMMLEGEDEIEVVGESGDGGDAVAKIRALDPDLVFLDVQMPEMSGFDVLAALAPEERPAVVFVTAHDEYALRAFDVHAVDYLLKPWDDRRFAEALDRAKNQLRLERVSDLSSKLASLLADVTTGDTRPTQPQRIAVKSSGRVVFLDVADIDWIEAADYYVQIHTREESHLHRQSMTSLERELDPGQFIRVHRSAIVNRERIRELRHQGRRDLVVVLQNGVEIKVARGQRDKLHQLF